MGLGGRKQGVSGHALFTLALLLWAGRASASSGRDFLGFWMKGDTAAMHAMLSPEAAKAFPLEKFAPFWPEPPLKVLREAEASDGYEARIADSEVTRKLELGFDAKGRVAIFKVTSPWDEPYPTPYAGHYPPYRFKFPFAPGTEWVVATGGHHKIARAQRFAYDILIVKDGATWSGDESDPRSYHAYGREILSPAAGVVAEVRDGAPDSRPRHMDPKAGLGNGVTIKVADGMYLFMTHFRPGSVAVRPGDAVREGQRLGEVGGSGHSWEPHLHVQLQTGPDERSDGLPLWFHDVSVNGRELSRALPSHGAEVRALEPRPTPAADALRGLAANSSEVR